MPFGLLLLRVGGRKISLIPPAGLEPSVFSEALDELHGLRAPLSRSQFSKDEGYYAGWLSAHVRIQRVE